MAMQELLNELEKRKDRLSSDNLPLLLHNDGQNVKRPLSQFIVLAPEGHQHWIDDIINTAQSNLYNHKFSPNYAAEQNNSKDS